MARWLDLVYILAYTCRTYGLKVRHDIGTSTCLRNENVSQTFAYLLRERRAAQRIVLLSVVIVVVNNA